jgi:hypothetical protein
MACAASALYAAAPAFAGEVTGNGKDTQGPAHAASLCAFSGLNDNPVNPPPMDFPGKIQNFAHFVFFLEDMLGIKIHPLDAPNHPSIGCNPNRAEEELSSQAAPE